MSRSRGMHWFMNPERFFARMLNGHVRGEYVTRDENARVFYRAVVLAVDTDGGLLQNPKGTDSLTHFIDGENVEIKASVGPRNPRNSIRARILTEEFDQFLDDDELHVFWPMQPEHDSIPIKPGEHVYVLFEDVDFQHGMWFGKVSGHEGLNYFRGQDSFTVDQPNELAKSFNDTDDIFDEDTSQETTDIVASGRPKRNKLSKSFGTDVL